MFVLPSGEIKFNLIIGAPDIFLYLPRSTQIYSILAKEVLFNFSLLCFCYYFSYYNVYYLVIIFTKPLFYLIYLYKKNVFFFLLILIL